MRQKQKTETSKASLKALQKLNPEFIFDKSNYMLLALGLFFILIGFILMAGGGSDNPNVFDRSIFSFRRITLAPILVLLGYIIEVYAIMKKPDEFKPIE